MYHTLKVHITMVLQVKLKFWNHLEPLSRNARTLSFVDLSVQSYVIEA